MRTIEMRSLVCVDLEPAVAKAAAAMGFAPVGLATVAVAEAPLGIGLRVGLLAVLTGEDLTVEPDANIDMRVVLALPCVQPAQQQLGAVVAYLITVLRTVNLAHAPVLVIRS